MNQTLVQDVVSEVMKRLESRGTRNAEGSRATNSTHGGAVGFKSSTVETKTGSYGVYSTVDDAVTAATESQLKFAKLALSDRDKIVKLIKSIAVQNAKPWGEMELKESKIGRLDHKIEKLQILDLVPGVEFLKTNAVSGSDGLTIEEFPPFGVIGIVTPVTHSIPTLTANAINMLAAGNAIVANTHPGATNCASHAAREYNKAIAKQFGIENLICCVVPPTLETAQQIFNHRQIPLLVVTGGAAVARAAWGAKRAIVAGPGNPPVVVDETACMQNAASSIVKGGAYDNNLLCIGEKQVFCVDSVFDKLMSAMENHGGYQLNSSQIEKLTKQAFVVVKDGKPHINKDLVGKDASVLAEIAGVHVPPSTQLLFGETPYEHWFVDEEQMMPFVPFVRCRDVGEAIDRAIESEHGYRHTALIHSNNLQTITDFARRSEVTIFVANGPSMAGLGLGGEGHLSYSIATPTGEGITNPLTFTRYRRMTMVGALRMI